MIFATLIFFLILLFVVYRRNGIDAAFYITALYVVMLIAGIFVIQNEYDPFGYADYPISVAPTIVFCSLIGLTIISVSRFDNNSIEEIHIYSMKTIPVLVCVFGIALLIYLSSQGTELISRLRYGDFAELRNMIYDEDLSDTHYSGIMGITVLAATIICSFSYIMIPIFCISLIWEQRNVLFRLLTLLCSMGAVFIGIMGIDRSKVFYYIIIWGLCIVMFWKKFSSQTRKRIMPVLIIGFILLMSYFALVTNDRFGERADGNKGGITWYAGQSYINFCYMWDYLDKPDEFSTRFLLPATNHFAGDYVSGLARQTEISDRTGTFVNVFYTFLGSFLVDCNKSAPFLYVLLYLLLMAICRRHKANNEISLFWYIFTWILIVIPTTGVISYMYNNYAITITIIIVLLAIFTTEYIRSPKELRSE